jgi:hypothetical protein
MSKYRTHTHDVLPQTAVKPKPGLPDGAIPIFDHQGRRRGHVSGSKASEATVRRFGVVDAKLGTKDGKPAWVGTEPNKQKLDSKHLSQVRQAKGSVSKNPSPPVTTARPKRG